MDQRVGLNLSVSGVVAIRHGQTLSTRAPRKKESIYPGASQGCDTCNTVMWHMRASRALMTFLLIRSVLRGKLIKNCQKWLFNHEKPQCLVLRAFCTCWDSLVKIESTYCWKNNYTTALNPYMWLTATPMCTITVLITELITVLNLLNSNNNCILNSIAVWLMIWPLNR